MTNMISSNAIDKYFRSIELIYEVRAITQSPNGSSLRITFECRATGDIKWRKIIKYIAADQFEHFNAHWKEQAIDFCERFAKTEIERLWY